MAMARILIIIAILSVLPPAAGSQTRLTAEMHLPCNGDEYVKTRVEYVEHADSGSNCLWDFSGARILDGNSKVKIRSLADSQYSVIEHRTAYKYKILGDTLRWLGFENRLTSIGSPAGVVSIPFPVTYGDTAHDRYLFTGRYCGTQELIEEGEVSFSVPAQGTLIIQCDTIGDVLMLRTVRHSRSFLGDKATPEILHSAADTIPLQIETKDLWYSPRYRYPLAEAVKYEYRLGEITVQGYSTAYLCLPSEQSYIGAEHNLQSDDCDTRTPNGGESRGGGISEASAESDSRQVTIHYRIDTMTADVEITLCDTHGRVYRHASHAGIPAGVHSETIDTSGIPPGDYLAVITTGNESLKLQVKLR